MPTPLFPAFEKRISDAVDRIVQAQVDPWLFMSNGLELKTFDGRSISYSGILFDGSPREVFWSGYIQPFLEDLSISELTAGVVAAKERDVDGRELLAEIQGLLLSACSKIFSRMADVDRRLRGQGFPEAISLRNVESEIAGMSEFIDRHVHAELKTWQARPSYERWYDRNKFWVWVAGIILGMAGLAVQFL